MFQIIIVETMNNSELIHQFVDGSLDPAQEDKLFMLLSSNEELRAELKEFIKIDKAFSKKLAAFVPPTSSTASLMTKLGIVAGAGIGSAGIIAQEAAKPGFWMIYGKMIITALITAGITGAIFFTTFADKIFSDDKSPIVAASNNQNNINPVNQSMGTIEPDNNSSNPTSSISGTENENQAAQPKVIIKKIYIERDDNPIITDNKSEENATVQNENLEQSEAAIIEVPDKNIAFLIESKSFYNNPISVGRLKYEAQTNQLINTGFITPKSELLGITLELKSSEYWQLPKPEINRSLTPDFHNASITALYSISDKVKLGAEFRNEHYYQEFSGNDELGNEYIYKQYPNYLSIGLSGRWYALDFDFAQAFTQLSIGGTKTGAFGRLMLGAEYKASKYYTFILSVEGSLLGYEHQGKLFMSPKIGINYGVGLNF